MITPLQTQLQIIVAEGGSARFLSHYEAEGLTLVRDRPPFTHYPESQRFKQKTRCCIAVTLKTEGS